MKRAIVVSLAVVALSGEVRAENGIMGSAALSGLGQGLSNVSGATSQMLSIYGASMLQQERFRQQQLLTVQHEFRALQEMKSQLDGYAVFLDTRAAQINRAADSQEKQLSIISHNRDIAQYQAQVTAYNSRVAIYEQWKTSLGF